MSETSLAVLRHDHAEVRAVIAKLRLVERELEDRGTSRARAALADILSDVVRHVFRGMRTEEAEVYPSVVRALGSDVPVRALLAEHRAIRQLTGALQTINESWDADGPEEPPRALRREIGRLAYALEMHLRREEAAFGAVLARQVPSVA